MNRSASFTALRLTSCRKGISLQAGIAGCLSLIVLSTVVISLSRHSNLVKTINMVFPPYPQLETPESFSSESALILPLSLSCLSFRTGKFPSVLKGTGRLTSPVTLDSPSSSLRLFYAVTVQGFQ